MRYYFPRLGALNMDPPNEDLTKDSFDRTDRRRIVIGALLFLNVLGSAIGLGVAVHNADREPSPRIQTQTGGDQHVGMKGRTYPTLNTLTTKNSIETTSGTVATTTTSTLATVSLEGRKEKVAGTSEEIFYVSSMEDLPLLGTYISKDGIAKESIAFFGTRAGDGKVDYVSSVLVSLETDESESLLRFIFDTETGGLSSIRNEQTGRVWSTPQSESQSRQRVTSSFSACNSQQKEYPWPEDFSVEGNLPHLHHVAYTIDAKYCGPEPTQLFATEQFVPRIVGSQCPVDLIREFVGGPHHNSKLVNLVGTEHFRKTGTHLFRAQRTLVIPRVQESYKDAQWTKYIGEETCRSVISALLLEKDSFMDIADGLCPHLGGSSVPCAKSISILSKLSGFSSSLDETHHQFDCSKKTKFLKDCQVMGLYREVIAVPWVSWNGISIPYKPYQYKWQSIFPNDVFFPSEVEKILADDASSHGLGKWEWTFAGRDIEGSGNACEEALPVPGSLESIIAMNDCSMMISNADLSYDYILDPQGGSSKEDWASFDHSHYVETKSHARIVSPFEIEVTSEATVDFPGDRGICRLKDSFQGHRMIYDQ